MNKFLAIALMTVSTAVFAQEVTKVPLGEITINEAEATAEVKTASGKKALKIEDDVMSFRVKQHFTNKAGDASIVLFQQSSGGNACPATYFIVEINKAGAVKHTPSFGTCSDIPKVKYADPVLTMKMPRLDGGPVTYEYKNGVVTENGKVVK